MEAPRGLLALPAELLQRIFDFATPESLLFLQQTSKRLKSIAEAPLLWRALCQRHYRFWQDANVSKDFTMPAKEIDWQKRFWRRKSQDKQIADRLQHILTKQTGRVDEIGAISDFKADAKDVLLGQLRDQPDKEDYLARDWWTHAILSHLQRQVALMEWSKIGQAESDEGLSLERALIAFDIFLETPVVGFDNVAAALDDIAEQLRGEQPELDSLSTREKVLRLLEFMRRIGFTGIDNELVNYHAMPNNLFGFAIVDAGHQTLPLVLVCIYHCLGKRLGIDIRATKVPMHCYGVVFAPRGSTIDGEPTEQDDLDRMFIDPFRHKDEVPPKHITDFMLSAGYQASSYATSMAAATIREVVTRVTSNLIMSHRTMRQNHGGSSVHTAQGDRNDAVYAAIWAVLLIAGEEVTSGDWFETAVSLANTRTRVVLWLTQEINSRFPWDVKFLEEFVIPTYIPWYGTSAESRPQVPRSDGRSRLHVETVQKGLETLQHFIASLRRHDDMPAEMKRRVRRVDNVGNSITSGLTDALIDVNQKVKYRVGTTIRHRRYGYEGVIVGWDDKCRQDNEWIMQMGVDALPEGRRQSFYKVVGADYSDRYVAQENIEVMSSWPCAELMSQAGQWFKRWDRVQGKFINNITEEYPDD